MTLYVTCWAIRCMTSGCVCSLWQPGVLHGGCIGLDVLWQGHVPYVVHAVWNNLEISCLVLFKNHLACFSFITVSFLTLSQADWIFWWGNKIAFVPHSFLFLPIPQLHEVIKTSHLFSSLGLAYPSCWCLASRISYFRCQNNYFFQTDDILKQR